MCKIGDKMFKLRTHCWLLLLLFVSNNLYSQNIKRSLSTVNAEFESGMEKMATLHNQLYIFGYGGANLQFGYSQFTQAYGSHKLFVAKYNDTGLYLKTVVLGGLGANIMVTRVLSGTTSHVTVDPMPVVIPKILLVSNLPVKRACLLLQLIVRSRFLGDCLFRPTTNFIATSFVQMARVTSSQRAIFRIV